MDTSWVGVFFRLIALNNEDICRCVETSRGSMEGFARILLFLQQVTSCAGSKKVDVNREKARNAGQKLECIEWISEDGVS